MNKIDLSGDAPGRSEAAGDASAARFGARPAQGMDALRDWLLEVAGWKPHGEGVFMARERHLVALGARRALQGRRTYASL